MEHDERVVSTEAIFDGKVVHLRIDTVRMADGREARREIVAHDGAACIVPVTDDGSVLMVRQYRLPAGQALLEVPAGKLEKGEDGAACAARELQEEVGFRPGHLEKLGEFYLAPGYSTELMHAFLATGLTRAQADPDEDEHVETVTLSLQEACRMAATGE